jgi:uncharacterized protein YggE
MLRGAPAALAAAPPIESGELTAQASVTVTFDIVR